MHDNALPTFQPDTPENQENSVCNGTTFDDVVRIVVSYDMGWSTRGTGRNYDSLNGFGAAIGARSGLVLDYGTCNRACKMCELGNHPSNHDCRKNFSGSAKAMEPHVAKKVIVESEILREQNIEVGVLIGDDDSSTIAACRAASNHPIIKQSDINHASGGVKKNLYKIQKTHGELRKDTITYLHRCFTYAVTQNKGNSQAMANAVRCIPYHAFNDHSMCGSWCGYVQNKENYEHTIIPGGLQDKKLFEALVEIFSKLADNAEKFSAGASSNINESLNSSMSAKNPKRICNSKSAAADYRFACVVGQKNIGEGYTGRILQSMQMNIGHRHKHHITRTDDLLRRRRILMRCPEYKKHRLLLKKYRSALRHRKENAEGTTYENNCTLLSAPATQETPAEESNQLMEDESGMPVVLFDLETSGFDGNAEILQMAAKSGCHTYAVYVTPTKPISHQATAVHGLINSYGDLMHNGVIVPSVPIRAALGGFQNWLQSSFNGKCCIAVHNLSFDGPRLLKSVEHCGLGDEYEASIHGFIDTLDVIRRVTKRKKCSISSLAEDLQISSDGAHNAINDVNILSNILRNLHINNATLLENIKLFADQKEHWKTLETTRKTLCTLAPLKKAVGHSVLKKIAEALIDMDVLIVTYNEAGEEGLRRLIATKESLKRIQKLSVDKIIEYFKSKH